MSKKKITLKRLSASDLTLFEYHFRRTPGAKQKAFNLDRSVFIGILYPSLADQIDITTDRISLDLSIFGPGMAPLHNLQREILKQQNNLRLDGELIYAPPGEDHRYTHLQKGDFAIIDFTGDSVPIAAKMYLVSQSIEEDNFLHKIFKTYCNNKLSIHKSMISFNKNELEDLIKQAHLHYEHPILDLLDTSAIESAVQGGSEEIRILRRRRGSRGVGKDEFDRARRNAEKIGRLGEELLNSWLGIQKCTGLLHDFKWESNENVISPYDFILNEKDGSTRLIDVKSTDGDFMNSIHISLSENVREIAKSILDTFMNVPPNVKIDSISVNPNYFSFSNIIIDINDEDDLLD